MYSYHPGKTDDMWLSSGDDEEHHPGMIKKIIRGSQERMIRKIIRGSQLQDGENRVNPKE
jgi:hypothetical protein